MSSDLSKIGHEYNYDNNYFRMILVALAKTLNRHIRWVYRFETGKKCVSLPFYSSMTGEQNFLLDSFVDDITDQRVELNTDQKQRGVITLENWNPVSDEFANPNMYIPKTVKINKELKRIVTKVKAIPIQLTYNVEIHLASEGESYICYQKILDMLYNYYFFSMDYYGLKIDLVLQKPDDKTFELPRDLPVEGSRDKIIKIPLTVRCYYPSWKVDTDKLDCGESIEFENMKKVYYKAYIHDMKVLKTLTTPNLNDPEFQSSKGEPPHDSSTPQEDFPIPLEEPDTISTLIWVENFNYPIGDKLTDHGWVSHSGLGINPITVTNGLTFAGYPSSGGGAAALIDNTGGDIHRSFTKIESGNVYIGFLINVSNTGITDYCMGIDGNPWTTIFRNRIWFKSSGSTNLFAFTSLSNNLNSTGHTYIPFNVGQTYLMISKYEIVPPFLTGHTVYNDISSLYIFDSYIPLTEPSIPTIGPIYRPEIGSTNGGDIYPGSVFLRQGSSSIQKVIISGIRVGRSWNDIVTNV